MRKTYRQADETERRLVKNMRKQSLMRDVIQKVIERSPDTLNSIINPTTSIPKTNGRPKETPVKILPKVLTVATRLQKKAKAEEEVTADMILEKAGVSARTYVAEHFQRERHQVQEVERKACSYAR